MVERKERCEACRWWKINDILGSIGRCRRYAPARVGQEGAYIYGQPTVTWDDFCGEWRGIPSREAGSKEDETD